MNFMLLPKRSESFFKEYCHNWCKYRNDKHCELPINKTCPIDQYKSLNPDIRRKFEKIISMWRKEHDRRGNQETKTGDFDNMA